MSTDFTYDQHPPDRDFGSTVLIVDDEESAQERLELALANIDEPEALHILQAKSISEAIDIASTHQINVILLDKNVGPDLEDVNQNGIEAIPELLGIQPHLQILMVTASNDIDDVVRAMKLGACGYITKEMPDQLLISHINKAIGVSSLKLEKIRRDRAANKSQVGLGGRSKIFRQVLLQAEAVAESNRPVLLLGETGTGKTALAKWINERRARFLKQKDRPFFHVNVAALPKDTIESELFGHEKGAFTDASERKQGFFELANNGTLFLDEIGEATLELQAKLLLAIEEGYFYRMGGTQRLRSTPKLILATNRNLEQMVEEGAFREDLYFRISMLPIQVPTLAERKEDIPDIVRSLLPKCCEINQVFISYEDLPSDFIEHLMNSKIDGNIRGVEHQLDRLLVLSPKDRNGRPVFKKWRSIPGLFNRGEVAHNHHSKSNLTLSLQEILERPFNVLGPDFPGWNKFLDRIADKVLLEASSKYKKNSEIARALDLAESSTYARLKRLSTHIESQGASKNQSKRERGLLQ